MPSLVCHPRLLPMSLLLAWTRAWDIERGGVIGVVGVGFARLDQLDGEIVKLGEVVGRVCDRVAFDAEETKVLQDRLFELGLPD